MAAQRTEKEETEFKVVPETVSGTNLNQVVGTTLNQVVPSPPRRFTSRSALSSILTPLVKASPERDVPAEDPVTEKREVRRCSGCRKKVGLTGFRCRCGDLFCSEHRYSDRHVCSYDYKAAGREAIAKENPLVKAAKIIRL